MQEKVIITDSGLGLGVFAKVDLQPRELIFYLNGKLIDFGASIEHMGEYSVQVGARDYVDPISPARFLNHSCVPNSGFIDDVALITLEPIKAGDEIRFDYSTTMLERHWELECLCGATDCRKLITDFDLLPLPLQTHYLRLGVVQNFILDEVAAVSDLAKQIA
jgi:uncharacterized protein